MANHGKRRDHRFREGRQERDAPISACVDAAIGELFLGLIFVLGLPRFNGLESRMMDGIVSVAMAICGGASMTVPSKEYETGDDEEGSA